MEWATSSGSNHKCITNRAFQTKVISELRRWLLSKLHTPLSYSDRNKYVYNLYADIKIFIEYCIHGTDYNDLIQKTVPEIPILIMYTYIHGLYNYIHTNTYIM